MHDLTIRPAAEADATSIAAIYNFYVRTSTATFDTQERSVTEQVAWLGEHTDPHPVLVAENDDVIVAWGSLSPWGTRCAYRHTVEISTYVAPDAAGQGIGPALTEVLIGRAAELGHHAIVSQIVHENEPSLSMAHRLGFEHIGTLREVGWKFDRWLDVVLMELVLDTDAAGDPTP
jgi:L-amino acid N-acyltransferase YncA